MATQCRPLPSVPLLLFFFCLVFWCRKFRSLGTGGIDDSRRVTVRERRNKRQKRVEDACLKEVVFTFLFFKRLACRIKDLFYAIMLIINWLFTLKSLIGSP